jgi:F-type H+-transporting ATPase subunit alpha
MELMKQNQYAPLTIAEMAVSLYAVDKGYIDDVEVNKVVTFETAMHDFLRSEHKGMLDKINDTGDYDDETEAALSKAIAEFKVKGTW